MKPNLSKEDRAVYGRIVSRGTMRAMFDFGYAIGRESILKEMMHDQQKLTDGFSHPTDCEECKKNVHSTADTIKSVKKNYGNAIKRLGST